MCGNHPFKCFGDEGEVGDGPVKVKVSWVSTRFFQDGCDSSQFESGGHSASGEGGVNYVGDHGRNGWQTGFDEGGGKRIKLTGGGFGFADEDRGVLVWCVLILG